MRDFFVAEGEWSALVRERVRYPAGLAARTVQKHVRHAPPAAVQLFVQYYAGQASGLKLVDFALIQILCLSNHAPPPPSAVYRPIFKVGEHRQKRARSEREKCDSSTKQEPLLYCSRQLRPQMFMPDSAAFCQLATGNRG